MILAIETSTAEASLVVFDSASGDRLWESSFTSDRAHNAAIFAPLAEALELAAAKHAIDLIVVGTGPGSYSGVRVGIAVANGVSLAFGVPCFGLSSLAALPTEADACDYQVIGDARRGEYFIVEIRDRRIRGEIILLSAETLGERLEGLTGPVFTNEASVAERFGVATLLRPTATELARIAARIDAEQIAEFAAQPLEPIYLRAPHITLPKRKVENQGG